MPFIIGVVCGSSVFPSPIFSPIVIVPAESPSIAFSPVLVILLSPVIVKFPVDLNCIDPYE